MAEYLTIDKIRVDTLKYLNLHSMLQCEVADIIGIDRSSFNRFLNRKFNLRCPFLLNLINLLYYDNKAEKSI